MPTSIWRLQIATPGGKCLPLLPLIYATANWILQYMSTSEWRNLEVHFCESRSRWLQVLVWKVLFLDFLYSNDVA